MVGCVNDPNGAVSNGMRSTCGAKDMCKFDFYTNACCETCHDGESI